MSARDKLVGYTIGIIVGTLMTIASVAFTGWVFGIRFQTVILWQ